MLCGVKFLCVRELVFWVGLGQFYSFFIYFYSIFNASDCMHATIAIDMSDCHASITLEIPKGGYFSGKI